MLIETVFIAVLVLILTYKKHKFNFVAFDYLPLLFFSIGLDLLSILIIKTPVFMFVIEITWLIQLAIYSTLCLFILLNIRHYRGFIILFIATLLNAMVIFFNDGFMPVDPQMGLTYGFTETIKLLESGRIFGHDLLNQTTQLVFLSDWITIPPPYIFPKTISIGDIFLDVGIVVLVIEMIVRSKTKMEGNNVV